MGGKETYCNEMFGRKHFRKAWLPYYGTDGTDLAVDIRSYQGRGTEI